MNKTSLFFDEVSVGYKNTILLKNINLELRPQSFVCLFGPNGSGKSSFLRSLLQILPLKAGKISYGHEKAPLSSSIMPSLVSVVFSTHSFPQETTVKEILHLGRSPFLGIWGKLKKYDEEIIEKSVKLFGLENLQESSFETLSDGQKQKVMIARSFVQDTPILLLDEPTNFLDAHLQVEILSILKGLTQDYDKTILFTSHNWPLILQEVSQLWMIHGKNIYETSPEEMILNKMYNKIFTHEEVHFSQEKGTFFIPSKKERNIQLFLENYSELEESWVFHFFRKNGLNPIKVESLKNSTIHLKNNDKDELNKSLQQFLEK